jgi:cytochrome c-type biogenesis protein CcmI
MNAWLFVGALLVVAAVVLVALPFLRRPGLTASEDRLEETDAARLELAEERDRALAALKELEFDHRTGKISDDDYRELVAPLRRRAADALRALEPRREHKQESKTRVGS